MGSRLQDAVTDVAGAVNTPPNVETLTIRPQGRMASDAAAEPREGGCAYPRLRQPGPAFASRGLKRFVLGVQQVQEAMATIQGVLEQLAPVLRSVNVTPLLDLLPRPATVGNSAHRFARRSATSDGV
jgi:hypothetical protein